MQLGAEGLELFRHFSGRIENANRCAPVAQLDRANASGALGREFESLRARHSIFIPKFRRLRADPSCSFEIRNRCDHAEKPVCDLIIRGAALRQFAWRVKTPGIIFSNLIHLCLKGIMELGWALSCVCVRWSASASRNKRGETFQC